MTARGHLVRRSTARTNPELLPLVTLPLHKSNRPQLQFTLNQDNRMLFRYSQSGCRFCQEFGGMDGPSTRRYREHQRCYIVPFLIANKTIALLQWPIPLDEVVTKAPHRTWWVAIGPSPSYQDGAGVSERS